MTTDPFRFVRPREVEIAVRVLWAGVALGVLGLLTAIADAPGYVSAATAIGIALQVFLTVKLADGHNWARIVLTVFIAISLVFGLIGIPGIAALFGYGALGIALGLLSLLQLTLSVLILVLIYQAPSNAWFSAPR